MSPDPSAPAAAEAGGSAEARQRADADTVVEEPAPTAATWPPGWGTPPPAWSPPPSAEPPRRPVRARRTALLLPVFGALALGCSAGAAIVLVHDHNESSATPMTAVIPVNESPINAAAATTADVETVARQLGPAVGTIVATGTAGSAGGSGALGSGFVITNANHKSYLVTNNHVVAGARTLRVLMPGGKNLEATVVGTDTLDDLAVVSVADGGLPTAVFGRSSDVVVGQPVIAIGSPLGNQGSVTSVVISALHRTITAGSGSGGATETLQDVLQTSAPINPGNSGGPLADAEGRVIGVNVAVAGQATNIAYSIPSDVAQQVVQQLIAGTPVVHPYIGIGFDDELAATEAGHPFNGPGVLVTKVQPGTPADQAGVKTDDIITAIDGVTLDQGQTVGGVLQRHKVGDTVKLDLRRGDTALTVSVTLVARPAPSSG